MMRKKNNLYEMYKDDFGIIDFFNRLEYEVRFKWNLVFFFLLGILLFVKNNFVFFL